MFVTVRLAIVVVVAAAAAALLPLPHVASFVAVNAALAALVAVEVARAPRAGELAFERSAPAATMVGREEPTTIEVHNPGSRDVEVALRDAAPPSLHRVPRTHRAVVPAQGRVRFDAVLRPERRGHGVLGPLTVRTAGPLRLAGRQATLAIPAEIKVYPPLPGRAQVRGRIERARELRSGVHSSAMRGGGSEFDSLRDYHPDDEYRRIDWSATARAGKPITRLYREERDQQILLVVDAGRMMAGSTPSGSFYEFAVDAAFALAELATYVGDRVGMVAFTGRVDRMVSPRSGREQPRRILDLLFDLEPRLEAPDYGKAFATLLARHRRRAMLVVFTQLTDERAMEPLFASLPAIVARHVVVIASTRDPSVAALVERVPADAQAAYANAAAAEALLGRERTAARLRAAGADVVDRPPGELAAAVADRYLSMKATGAL